MKKSTVIEISSHELAEALVDYLTANGTIASLGHYTVRAHRKTGAPWSEAQIECHDDKNKLRLVR